MASSFRRPGRLVLAPAIACLAAWAHAGCAPAPPPTPSAPAASPPTRPVDDPAARAREREAEHAADNGGLIEKMHAGVEASCREGWCRVGDECVAREPGAPSCMAQIATRNALVSRDRPCEGVRVVIWGNSGWQTKLREAERIRAHELFTACDERSLDLRYKCFSIPLHEEERAYCKATVAAAAQQRAKERFSEARDACVAAFAEGASAAPGGCEVPAPAPEVLSSEEYRRMKAECDSACAERAPEARKRYVADAPKRAETRAKCRRCFLAPAAAARGLESWCDARVSASEYQRFVGPACDSACANRRAYDACVKK